MTNQSSIVKAGRALLCLLQPFTGSRAVGQIRLKAKTGKQIKVARYAYVMPVIDGAQHWSWLFKVGPGPEPDESWIVGDTDTLIPVYSAIGGQRFNVHLGTTFVFDYLLPDLDLDPAPYAVADFLGGTEPQDEFGSLKDAAVYETFDGPAIPLDMRRSLLTRFPAALIAFIDLMPADGITSAQTTLGYTNAGTGTKFYKVNFAISLIVSRTDNDLSRRFQGMVLTDKVLAELVDRHAVNDGEPLSNPGGVQIRQVIRENGPQDLYKKFFIFTILASVMCAISRPEDSDGDQFPPWLRAKFSVDHPQSPALPNQGTLRVVDSVIVDMAAGLPDITLDGVFTRASVADYWDGSILLAYAAGVRRIVGGRLLLEPAVGGIGAEAIDITLWSTIAGATVSAPNTSNPRVTPTSANTVSFAAAIGSGVELAANAASAGNPHVFYVFVKAASAIADAVILSVDDGVAEFESTAFDVGTEWSIIRFESTPAATPVTLRVKNALATAHDVAVWGAFFDSSARWGAEFADSKVKDVLTFAPYDSMPLDSNRTPFDVIGGKWAVSLLTLDYVMSDLTGAGLATAPVVVSVNDGATDLLLMTLAGTPLSGGATFELTLRGHGTVLALQNVMWSPGDLLQFKLDAQGQLELIGTQSHDGVYAFPRYDVNAVQASDRLVFGDDASGTRGAVPGFYSVEIG